MIVDAFTFCDELDLLDLRLHVLDRHVDYFVLVESPVTFQGDNKPMWFAENRDRFARWKDRIIRVEFHPPADAETPWLRENLQRNAVMVGLRELPMRHGDVVVLSDVDEVWQNWTTPRPLAVFEQIMFVGNLGWRHPNIWCGSTAAQFHTLAHLGEYPMATLREARNHTKPERVANGGWHFTYFGGPDAVRRKLQSYAHTEYRDAELTPGKHIDGTALVRQYGVDKFLPQWILTHAPESWWP